VIPLLKRLPKLSKIKSLQSDSLLEDDFSKPSATLTLMQRCPILAESGAVVSQRTRLEGKSGRAYLIRKHSGVQLIHF
jgi:hypothetical protein